MPYHNFKHVVDVMQATFHLLVRIGTLPPFPRGSQVETRRTTRLVSLLRPFEALTLLIAAIGHDIGHPGVNNMFLVKINAPLARLYNDKSVLESYHTALYCHMLKRLWPAVVENEEMKGLLTSCILSTDMGIHNEYMEKLTFLQKAMENLPDDQHLGEKELLKYRDIACNMLIKCADISNVVSHNPPTVSLQRLTSTGPPLRLCRQVDRHPDLGVRAPSRHGGADQPPLDALLPARP